MCGIAGIYNFKGYPPDRSTILAMTNAMSHRGPDADGIYHDDYVALGHRRLAIIDLTPAGNQPFKSSNGRFWMVFNGELYNFKSVKAAIKDHTFISTGDTEVLMEGWVRWGIGVVEKLKGMFSFAIWDTVEKELVICRDRLGVKPLYYYQDNDKLVFASEIRAILVAGNIKRKVSHEALESFFAYQSVTGEQTIIEGIKEVKAGCFLYIKGNQVETKRYWNILADKEDKIEDKQSAKKKIRELLRVAVEQRLVSDVPVGAFLSGGIDSSAVVGLMAEVSGRRPETFNVSFQEEAYDESAYAKIIAKKFNTNHHEILLKPEVMLDNLMPALKAMDTPSGDGINSFVVSKAIREAGITVALSGIGGDELFAGYPFFKQYKSIRNHKKLWAVTYPLRQMAAKLLVGNDTKKERLRQLLQLNGCSIAELYPIFRNILPPEKQRGLINIHRNTEDIMTRILCSDKGINNFPDYSQISIAEYLGYTQHTLLKDTDQMSMAVSLEVREPFFDHELIEYVLRLSDKFKEPVYPKKLLVESLGGLLPDEIVHRKKQGFVFPWADWMKKELKDFCSEKISSISQRSFVKEQELIGEWKKFLKGDPAVRWMEIWLFVILEQWLQQYEAA